MAGVFDPEVYGEPVYTDALIDPEVYGEAPLAEEGGTSVSLALISQTAVPSAPTITTGSVDVSLALLDQTAATFAPTVTTGVSISLVLLDQTAVPLTPTLTGASSIDLALLDQTAAASSPTVAHDGAEVLDLALIDQTSTPSAPVITATASIELSLLDQTAAAFDPASSASISLALGLIDQTAATFTATVVPGVVTVTLGRISATATPRTPTLVYNQFITLGLINRAARAHVPSALLPEQLDGTSPIIELLYGGDEGVDVISDVVIADAKFISQVNGVAGNCYFRVKDPLGTHSFTVGEEIVLKYNGQNLWRGFVARSKLGYAFDAQNTFDPTTRFFIIDGSDINILFQRRIVFNQANYLDLEGPLYTANNTWDTTALTRLFADYLDPESDGLNTTELVDHVGYVNIDHRVNPIQPAQTWDNTMKVITKLTNAIYYIDPDKKVVHADVDTPSAPFLLSDQGAVAGGGTIGYREMELDYDGTNLINDALIWGVALGGDSVVMSRNEDATSQTAHGRWQYGELNGSMYKQGTVDRRAESLVDGSPLSKRGGKNDRISVAATVFEPGFRVGQKVDFTSTVYDYNDVLPIRRMEITFINPTTPRYRLFLSHEIDTPWSFFDNYNYRYNIPKFGGIDIDIDIPKIPDVVLDPCTDGVCGITDTFTRVISPNLTTAGVSDSGEVWSVTGWGFNDNSVAVSDGAMTMTVQDYVEVTLPGVPLAVPLGDAEGWAVTFEMRFDTSDVQTKLDVSILAGSQYLTNVRFFRDIESPSTANIVWSVPGGMSLGQYLYIPMQTGVWYHVRLTGVLVADTYTVRGNLWEDGDPEPSGNNLGIGSSTFTTPLGGGSLQLVTQVYDALTTAVSVRNLDIEALNRCTAVQFDDFNRTVASGWGTSTSGSTWQSLLTSGTASVTGTVGRISATGGTTNRMYTTDTSGPWHSGEWTMTSRFKVPDGVYPNAPYKTGYLAYAAYPIDEVAIGFQFTSPSWNGLLDMQGESPVYLNLTVGGWYTIKWFYSPATGVSSVKVWQDGTAEPGWMITRTQTPFPDLPTEFRVHTQFASGGTVVYDVDYIEFDYTGKPCYPAGSLTHEETTVVPLSGPYCEVLANSVGGTQFATSRAWYPGSLKVYVNGVLVTAYTSDPVLGEITLTSSISSSDVLYVCYQANGYPA